MDPRLRARSVQRSGRDTVRVRRNFGSPAAATKFYCSTRGGGHRCSWSSPSAEVARACARAGRDRARTVYLVPPMHAVAARIIVGWSGAAGLAAVPALGGGGEARRPRSELAYHHRSRGQARSPRAAAGRRPRHCQAVRGEAGQPSQGRKAWARQNPHRLFGRAVRKRRAGEEYSEASLLRDRGT